MISLFKKKAFGLDISDKSIEALELEKKSGKVFLKAYGRAEMEQGIVQNGRILNKGALAEKIGNVLLKAEPRAIKIKNVICSLPESQTFIHFFPNDENIEQQAAKTFPINLSDFYFNFKEGFFSAAPKILVDNYLSVLSEAGLDPVALDLESASIARAFEGEMNDEKVVYLVVDIGSRATVLSFYDNKEIKLSAAVSAGGETFSKTLSQNLKMPLEKAEELKRTCGFDVEKRDGEIIFVLQGPFQEIINGIKDSVKFYQNKSGKKVAKIILCGGSSLIPKVDFYLTSIIDIPVVISDPWQGIDVEEILQKEELRKIIETKLHPIFFANVIGLAKRGLAENPSLAGPNLIPKKK
ncbi:MAG: pilus assembly protein PilM [Candidatus Pacebacteria bacterium]|jgi:Tfp pilus assembly PilM family ATPase|nr:pilus assembly protein PilM [Candidatus Paceibacterota bacterium]